MDGASSWLQQYYQAMSSSLERMYTSGAHTDTTIIVEERTFQCHRVILCAMSPYFDSMFTSGMKESVSGKVNFEGVESSVFESILEYIYKGSDIVNSENAQDVLTAACLLQMECLQRRSEEFICDNLTVSNCIEMWRMAIWHSYNYIKPEAWVFILSNFVKLSQDETFLCLEKDELLSIINNEDLNCINEDNVAKSVIEWFQHDLDTRGQFLGELFSYLKLPFTDWSFLRDMKHNYPFLEEHAECNKCIERAKEMHNRPAIRQECSSPIVTPRKSSFLEDVLVVISHRSSMARTRDFLAFSFNSRKWFKLEPLPYDPGVDFATCVYSDDIFLTGGFNRNSGYLQYRSPRNRWVDLSEFNLLTGRMQHAMAVCGKRLYVIGGYTFKDNEGYTVLRSIEELCLGNTKWEEVGSLYIEATAISATAYDDKLYIFGGRNRVGSIAGIQCFDTRSRTSSLILRLPEFSTLTRATVCDNSSYVVLTDGTIVQYVHGKTTTTVLGQISDFQRDHFGLAHRLGCLYILGGQIVTEVPRGSKFCVDTMHLYDIANKTVNILDDKLPQPRYVEACGKISILKKHLEIEEAEKVSNTSSFQTIRVADLIPVPFPNVG